MGEMPIAEILDGALWQSDADPLLFARMRARNITPAIVIDLQEFPLPEPPLDAAISYVHWPIDDGPLPDAETLAALVEASCVFIEHGGRIVTMCAQGRNRSGLVSALIVCGVRRVGGREAVRHVRERVPEALSNEAFVEWLTRGRRSRRRA
jgi:protein-tyrosine phosphatase